MRDPAPADRETARRLVEARTGLEIPPERERELSTVLRARAHKSAADDVAGYLARLEGHAAGARAEIDRVAAALAVHETYFFRDPGMLDVVVDRAIPDRAAGGRRVHVLSAGSSTGAEAYSIAILLRERQPALAARVEILGVDLAGAAVEVARGGRYLPWALRGAPPELVERWFQRRGDKLELSAEVRAMASFEARNLVGDEAVWAHGAFDVVLCRNVLMYLSHRAAKLLVARLARSLAPGGYLFLSPSETLYGLDAQLLVEVVRGAGSYYRKPRAPACDSRVASPRALDVATREPAMRATEPAEPRDDRDRASHVRRAIALIDRGDLAHAEEACARAASGELDPTTLYLSGLCRDRAGDREGAIRDHTAAACLDPTFAMPCVHLALLGRRGGDRRAAKRELARALVLVEREDEARIALFGGGLDRDAWLRICRAELSREEAAP